MSLARRSSAFSRRRRFNSANSSLDGPRRRPASTSARRTHVRTVSAVGPNLSATEQIASHCDPYSCSWSRTIRTARSRSSLGYPPRLDMTPSSSRTRASTKPGTVHHPASEPVNPHSDERSHMSLDSLAHPRIRALETPDPDPEEVAALKATG